MNKSRKTWFLVTVLMLMMAVIVGCSQGASKEGEGNTGDAGENKNGNETEETEGTDEGSSSSEPWELGSEELELTMFGNYDWYTMPPWGEDVSTEWIKENKKVNITAIDGGGDAAQRLSTMIVDGKLPDFIWTDKGADVEKLRQGGVLVPFDDYLDKYPNLKDWFGEAGLNMLRSEDGKLYQFPNWYNSQPFGNAGYVVNKKIYEELGEPALETTDDLYEYLKMVKDKFPDVVPFEPYIDGQGIAVLYSAFAEGRSPGDIRRHAVAEGDKLTSIFENEEYIETQKYANKLFREKLITQDALSQDKDMSEAKITSGKFAVLAAASPTEVASVGHYNEIEKDPDAGFFYIWPVHKPGLNKDEIYPGDFSMMGWNVSVITTSAEDPEKVFAFLDWLTGPEGQSSLIFGPEGKYWDGFDEEGLPQFTEEYVTDAKGVADIDANTGNFQWNGNSNFLDKAKAKFTATLPIEERRWDTHWQSEVTWKTQANGTEFENINPLPDSEEGRTLQSINDIAEEARAQSLFAKSEEEVESVWKKAAEDAKALGHEQLLEFQTAKWLENKEKLGE